ncbi:hypothetical protein [Chryseobacterium sp. c4a]|uniref:hypothetical protein n=1 Tax=Chryseobacterium sp. c4a TaxID=1573582 RepID=UPI001356927A|nr:hypothetical protein [Chryseobacterium sp. c4a]
MKKISELSIADLKAAHDFLKTSLDSLNEIEKDMDEEEITPERIKASERLNRLHNYLYHELLNRVISLDS